MAGPTGVTPESGCHASSGVGGGPGNVASLETRRFELPGVDAKDQGPNVEVIEIAVAVGSM